mgnify:CR=1 FL=1
MQKHRIEDVKMTLTLYFTRISGGFINKIGQLSTF